MNKFALLFVLSSVLFSQEPTRWQDHFSYKNVLEIIEINGILYCATENGLFTYDAVTGEIVKNSKVNDLNDVGISALTYNEANDFIMVGYESGELDFLGADENFNFLEIPLDDFQGSKTVNHISTYENSAVFSGEFGVATFSLVDLEFDETAFFNTNGQFINVNETVVREGIIYAASESGIFIHPLDDFIPNFPAWTQPNGVPTSNFLNIEAFNNQVFAATNSQIYQFDGTQWTLFGTFSGIQNLKSTENSLLVIRTNEIISFDTNLSQTSNTSFDENLNTGISLNSILYGGTRTAGLVNSSSQESLFPSGPFSNNSYGITAYQGQIFIAPGLARGYNAPAGNAEGYFHFNLNEWIHNSSQEMNGARDVIQITVNPNDSTEVWVSTWNQNRGLFKMKSGEVEMEFNPDNSAFVEIDRIGGTVFDDDGTLWAVQSFTAGSAGTNNFMVSISPNGDTNGIALGGFPNGTGTNEPIFHPNGFIIIPGTRGAGVMIVNSTDDSERYSINEDEDFGELPIDRVRRVALDDNNILWIVTQLGLRILRNPIETVRSGDFQTESIIIEQNGIPEELFFEVSLTDVAIDGANRKWIATDGAGVFYLSEDGTETLLQFNTSNSPLPSNTVFDISVDESTGRVYFATDRGAVSYGSDVTLADNTFRDVLAFPNPVRPGYTGNVTIRGLADNADVRITDVVGNLIFSGTAAGGVIEWDTNNQNGVPVASGIYLVLMTNRDASETAYTKIAIVR